MDRSRRAAPWDLAMVRLRVGQYLPFPTPEEALAYDYTGQDREVIAQHRKLQFIGSPETVTSALDVFAEQQTGADEFMVATFVHSAEERLRPLELLAGAWSPAR